MGMTVQDMLAKMQATLKDRTGKGLDAWIKVAKKSGLDRHKALTVRLKTDHGLNHNEAQWIAWGVTDPDRLTAYDRPDDLVAELYSGKREHLRPVYEALLKAALSADKTSKPTVCKGYTSVKNRAQYCMINPRTLKGVDLELSLPAGTTAAGRLESMKDSNPRFAHRVRITAKSEVNAEVKKLLKIAADHVRG